MDLKTNQIIDCGAVLTLDDAVIKHGVIFVHPLLPPLRLMFDFDPKNKGLPKYYMEPITAEHGNQTQFVVHVHDSATTIIVPEDLH